MLFPHLPTSPDISCAGMTAESANATQTEYLSDTIILLLPKTSLFIALFKRDVNSPYLKSRAGEQERANDVCSLSSRLRTGGDFS